MSRWIFRNSRNFGGIALLLNALTFYIFLYYPIILVLAAIISIVAIYLGSDLIVDQSTVIGSRFGLSQKRQGYLILSIASVADELFLTIIAASLGFGDISLGAVQGSNVVTMAVALIMMPLVIASAKVKGFQNDLIILIGITCVFLSISLVFSIVPIYIAPLLIGLFVLYFLKTARRGSEEVSKVEETRPSYLSLALSIALLFVSSLSLVEYTRYISVELGISYFLGSFILTGISGSIPELFVIYITFRKSLAKSAIAVLIGSTVYKLTLVLGIVTLFGNLVTTGSMWSLYFLVFLSGLLIIVVRKSLRKYMSIILAACSIVSGYLLFLYA